MTTIVWDLVKGHISCMWLLDLHCYMCISINWKSNWKKNIGNIMIYENYWKIFHEILSVSWSIVMDMNNVIENQKRCFSESIQHANVYAVLIQRLLDERNRIISYDVDIFPPYGDHKSTPAEYKKIIAEKVTIVHCTLILNKNMLHIHRCWNFGIHDGMLHVNFWQRCHSIVSCLKLHLLSQLARDG